MKRRIALSLLALPGMASLSACRAAPVMTDVKQSVPPGLLVEDLWQSSQSTLLLDTTFGFWREQKNWGSLEQVGMFKAPADYGMQQAVDFYQQRLSDERWQLQRGSRLGCERAAWVSGLQALLLSWYSEPVEWGKDRVRLVLVLATAVSEEKS